MRNLRRWFALGLTLTMIGGTAVFTTASTETPSLIGMSGVEVADTDYVQLIEYYSKNLDIAGYIANNPDLIQHLGNDPAAYVMHYVYCGIPEGRTMGKWDPVAYVINNKEAIMESVLKGETDYFNLEVYKSKYPDLVLAFGDDVVKYINHYVTIGIIENRLCYGIKFDPVIFAYKYPNANVSTNASPEECAEASVIECDGSQYGSSDTGISDIVGSDTSYNINRGVETALSDDLLEQYYQINWNKYSIDYKKGINDVLCKQISALLGIDVPTIEYYVRCPEEDGSVVQGQWKVGSTSIRVNEDILYSAQITFKTIAHELRHLKQYKDSNSDSQLSVIYKIGFNEYIDSSVDMDGYNRQYIEVDADRYADSLYETVIDSYYK